MNDTVRQLIIIGAGATGIEVADMAAATAERTGQRLEIVAVDDAADSKWAKWDARGIDVLGSTKDLPEMDGSFVVAVGEPHVVARLTTVAERAGLKGFEHVRHATSVTAPGVEIGDGSILYANTSVSTDVRIGRFCQIHLGVTLGHDVVIGDHCVITPGVNIGGGAVLGDNVFVGSGAVVLPSVTIGAGTTVGASAVVTRDLPPNVVAYGSPAKPMREKR